MMLISEEQPFGKSKTDFLDVSQQLNGKPVLLVCILRIIQIYYSLCADSRLEYFQKYEPNKKTLLGETAFGNSITKLLKKSQPKRF